VFDYVKKQKKNYILYDILSMESSMYLTSTIIALVYFIYKFIVMKYTQDEEITIKDISKESIFVFGASLCGLFLVSQFNVSSLTKNSAIPVFTDEPPF